MKRLLICVLMVSAMAVMSPPVALATDCVPNYPSVIVLGQPYCVSVCSLATPGTIQIEGNDTGSVAIPQLIFESGCALGSTHCDVQCNAIAVPTDFGIEWNPNSIPPRYEYHGISSCLEIRYYFVHDAIWTIEIYATCSGCFCMTFDRQLGAELTAFAASSGTDGIRLHWTTSSENGSAEWIVERSESATEAFTPMGHVPASGFTATATTYSWLDRAAQPEITYYYRLSERDVTGRIIPFNNIVHAELVSGSDNIPATYDLKQNFPNPFNPSTEIEYVMKEAGFVSLKVYNMIGQEIATLVNDKVTQGPHLVIFDASGLPSALYIYKMETIGFTAVNKMLLMK